MPKILPKDWLKAALFGMELVTHTKEKQAFLQTTSQFPGDVSNGIQCGACCKCPPVGVST